MKIQSLILMLFAVWLFSSCNEDDIGQTTGDGLAVQFKSENLAVPQTRTSAAGDKWTAGDKIGIYMMASGGDIADAKAANIAYKAEGSDATTSFTPVDASETIHYPQTGTTDFIAYYPWKATGAGTDYIDNYLFSVNTATQTAPAAIDLLYSNNVTGKARSKTEAVALKFDHVLSKITLNIAKGNGMNGVDFSGIIINIEGMNTTAEFDLATGIMGASATPAPVTPHTTIAGAKYDAIVIPQTSPATAKVTFTINSVSYVWKMGSHEFTAANEYIFDVTVNETSVTVTDGGITPWNTDTPVTGEALSYRTLTYVLNGGTGTAPSVVTVKPGTTVTLSDGTGITAPAHKSFNCWCLAPDEEGTWYKAGADIVVADNIILYASYTGDGSSEAYPIHVREVADLEAHKYGMEYCYKLMNDISGITNYYQFFFGTFDGNGYTIDVDIFDQGYNSGLFHNKGGTIKNLRVTGKISGYQNVGGIVAINEAGGSVIACRNDATITSKGFEADPSYVCSTGGVVGYNAGNVTACYNTGTIIDRNLAVDHVGGVVGNNVGQGVIKESYSSGTLSGTAGVNWRLFGYFTQGQAVDCYYVARNGYTGGDNATAFGTTTGTTAWPAWTVDASGETGYWKSLGTKGTADYPKLWWEE